MNAKKIHPGRFVLFIVIALLPLLHPGSTFADGKAKVSFKTDFLPIIAHNANIMPLLKSYDIYEWGWCRVVIEPRGTPDYIYPYVFLAKLKGDKGPYRYIIVIDHVYQISTTTNQIVTSTNIVDSSLLGVSIWPLKKPMSLKMAQQYVPPPDTIPNTK